MNELDNSITGTGSAACIANGYTQIPAIESGGGDPDKGTRPAKLVLD